MHSSRMRTIRCSTVVSPATHTPCHACPSSPRIPSPFTMQAPLHHTCPLCHTCPPLPCIPPSPCIPPLPHRPPSPHPHFAMHPPFTTHRMDRMTDACENITFPELLLRTVIKQPRVVLTKTVPPLRSMTKFTLNDLVNRIFKLRILVLCYISREE